MAFNLDHIAKKQTFLKEKAETPSFLKKEIILFNNAFSNNIKEDFYTELSVLLKAGITLKDGLELIQNSQKKKQNKDVLSVISHDIV